jgi:hypothetical protein
MALIIQKRNPLCIRLDALPGPPNSRSLGPHMLLKESQEYFFLGIGRWQGGHPVLSKDRPELGFGEFAGIEACL